MRYPLFTRRALLALAAANLLACATFGGPGAQADATPPEAAAPQLITTEGVISMVEQDGTVVIVIPNVGAKVIHLTQDAKVTRNGSPATVKELKAGDRAVARHGAGGAAMELSAVGR